MGPDGSIQVHVLSQVSLKCYVFDLWFTKKVFTRKERGRLSTTNEHRTSTPDIPSHSRPHNKDYRLGIGDSIFLEHEIPL